MECGDGASAIGAGAGGGVSAPVRKPSSSRLRRAIVHEFGHVVGVGHSRNPGDIMFSGGAQETPTASDLEACNRAIEERYGVGTPRYARISNYQNLGSQISVGLKGDF